MELKWKGQILLLQAASKDDLHVKAANQGLAVAHTIFMFSKDHALL